MRRYMLALNVFAAAAIFAAQASFTSTAPAGGARAAPAGELTSPPGPAAGGLIARLQGPAAIEENDFLKVTLQLATEAKSLPADVRWLDLNLYENRCVLTLRDSSAGKSFTVTPFDASAGMPPVPDGHDDVALDGKPLAGLPVMFPLRTAHVPAGDYDCTLTFQGARPSDAAPNYWLARATTGVLKLKVEKETPKTFIAFVPRSLHRDAANILKASADDLEKLTLPIGNGLTSGCATSINGNLRSLSGGISGPNDPNLDGFIHEDAAKTTEITISIFVTGTPPQHMWDPGSDQENYHVVWSRTFDASGAATTPQTKPF